MTAISPNVLITCGGKWVGIVLQLRQAMQSHPGFRDHKIIVASSDALTPAGCFADYAEQVPLIKAPDYIDRLFEVCCRHRIGVVIPLIDLDLERLAPHIERFAQVGVNILCPTPKMVELCLNKLLFAQFCHDQGIPHPKCYSLTELHSVTFPVFYKRQRGFGSIGSGLCSSLEEAQAISVKTPDTIFQELIQAPEFSVDAYLSRRGECIICVPRSRDKVVAGESYKTQTVNAPQVMKLARQMIQALASAGLRGALNVQIFGTNPPCVLEVNTRLGSACVLSNMAVKGRLFEALLAEAGNEVAEGNPDDYLMGLSLTRFLGDVFHCGTEVVAILPH